MTIIPKEEMDAQNAKRYAILQLKRQFVDLVEEVQKTNPEFTGSGNDISLLEDSKTKDKFSTIAQQLADVPHWFTDCTRMLKNKKERISRKEQ